MPTCQQIERNCISLTVEIFWGTKCLWLVLPIATVWKIHEWWVEASRYWYHCCRVVCGCITQLHWLQWLSKADIPLSVASLGALISTSLGTAAIVEAADRPGADMCCDDSIILSLVHTPRSCVIKLAHSGTWDNLPAKRFCLSFRICVIPLCFVCSLLSSTANHVHVGCFAQEFRPIDVFCGVTIKLNKKGAEHRLQAYLSSGCRVHVPHYLKL